MFNEEKKVWGIHTMDDNLFLNKNVIAIGWRDFGDCSKLPANREAFKQHYVSVYPDAKKGSIPTCAGMLYRFTCEMNVGLFSCRNLSKVLRDPCCQQKNAITTKITCRNTNYSVVNYLWF